MDVLHSWPLWRKPHKTSTTFGSLIFVNAASLPSIYFFSVHKVMLSDLQDHFWTEKEYIEQMPTQLPKLCGLRHKGNECKTSIISLFIRVQAWCDFSHIICLCWCARYWLYTIHIEQFHRTTIKFLFREVFLA